MTSGAHAWLVDQRSAKAYPLAEEATIGRGGESTVVLRDPAVSRRHAEITREGDAYVLRAMGSAGTLLNGVRVATDCVLQEGDLIEIAFTTLRFTKLAPTGEMFVVPREAVYARARVEPPTRATLHRLHPITLMSRWRRYWHLLLALLLVVLVLTICA